MHDPQAGGRNSCKDSAYTGFGYILQTNVGDGWTDAFSTNHFPTYYEMNDGKPLPTTKKRAEEIRDDRKRKFPQMQFRIKRVRK